MTKKQIQQDIVKLALENKHIFTEALFKRPESLSKFLPYDEFIEDKNIHLLKDGSLGAVFSATLLEHETMTSRQIIDSIHAIKPWFSLPENCTLQILFDQGIYSQKDPEICQIEKSFPNAHPVSKVIFDERMKSIKESCLTDKAPLKRKLYISIRYFPKVIKTKSAQNLLQSGNTTLYQQLKGFIRELQDFQGILRSIETSSPLILKRLCSNELLIFLRNFFNPKSSLKRNFSPFNKNFSLSEQFIYNSPTLDFEGIEREGVKSRTITLKTTPIYAYPGGMSYFTNISFPFKLSLNVSFPSKGKTKRFFDFKEFFLENSPTAQGKLQLKEVRKAQKQLAHNDRCLHLTFNIIIEGENDQELDHRTQEVLNIFHHKLEADAIVEKDVGLGLALNSLPLAYTPDVDFSSQRAIKILRSDLQLFTPLFDSFRGLKNPLSLFLSREKSLVPFNLLENETSNHTAVLADTGSGKSAFIAECIKAAKRLDPEPIIFIIDKKSSYTMLSEFYGGDFTAFDRDKEIPFSPFRGSYDEEKISFLTRLFTLAIKLVSPSFDIESEHQAAITKALKTAYLKKYKQRGILFLEGELIEKGNKENIELTMDDFITELGSLTDEHGNDMHTIVDPLISKLRPFWGDGQYAYLFKGSSKQKNTSNKFFVYDLEGLSGDPVAQTLMAIAITGEIRRVLALPENQGKTSFLVLEEFNMLGRNNTAFKDFAIDFAETMRKKGCWLITLTPRPQNYFNSELGEAFWSVADNYVFLQMNSDNVDYVAKNSSLLDEATREIVRSLRTKKNEYAEIFYTNKSKSCHGAFRYHQTSLDRWLSPTNAKDMKEAINALNNFNNKWDALKYLCTNFPNGTSSSI